ncbi:MAG TPA: SRPBCC family protein [Vicinamibacterales bacterium]|nr:SRPBCC family protein [Vicinamibacterales bacterium]
MTTLTVSSEIGAPVDQVFRQFTDIERVAQEVSGIRSIEVMTPGPFGLGTRWREVREVPLGRLDDAEMEVTSFDRNRGYTITHHKGPARIVTTFSFEPIATGTRVAIEYTMDGPGLPPALLSPLGWAISGKVREVLTQDLSDLKAAMERQGA